MGEKSDSLSVMPGESFCAHSEASNHLTNKHHMNLARFFSDIMCLNMGVLCLGVMKSEEPRSIDAALALFDPEQSRKIKRKFRKQCKKISKKDRWKNMTRSQKRSAFETEVQTMGALAAYEF